jgi:hypothetical protein
MAATGSVYIGGNLDVSKNLVVSDKFNIDYLTGTTLLNGALTVTKDFNIFNSNNNKFIIKALTGNTIIAGTLDVSGNTIIDGELLVNNKVNINNDLTVSNTKFIVDSATGNTTIAGDLNVNNSIQLNGGLTINTDNFVVNPNGNTFIQGTLDISRNILMDGSLNISNKFIVNSQNGNVDISGNINHISMNVTPQAVNVLGNLNVNNKMLVNSTTGLTSINGMLDLSNDFAINTNKFTVAAATGNTLIAGALNVNNNLTIYSNKFTINATSGNTFTAGSMDINGNLRVGNNGNNIFTVNGTNGNINGSNITVDNNVRLGTNTSVLNNSIAIGNNSIATGNNSIAIGNNSVSTHNNAVVFNNNSSEGDNSMKFLCRANNNITSTNSYPLYQSSTNEIFYGPTIGPAGAVTSDIRMKENIKDIDRTDLVNILNRISLKQYDFKYGDKNNIGIIANDLKNINNKLIEQFVYESPYYVDNIMKEFNIIIKNEQILIYMDNIVKQEFKKGDWITYIVNGKNYEDEIVEINDDSIVIKYTMNQHYDNKIFIKGKWVEDFLQLKINNFHYMLIASNQELHNKVEMLESRLAKIEKLLKMT